jgi:chromosome segregation ATPase
MHEKNENVFLWLLEQNRQKSRAHVLQENKRNLSAQPPIIFHNPLFNGATSQKDDNKRPAFVTTRDLEQLMKEKTGLENELHSLEEKQRKLDLRARVLCAKVIQETRKRNSEKRQVVNQLRERFARIETLSKLDESIQERQKKNHEKQQEISRLRETISTLETQFVELSISDVPQEETIEKVASTQDTPTSKIPQMALVENENVTSRKS